MQGEQISLIDKYLTTFMKSITILTFSQAIYFYTR